MIPGFQSITKSECCKIPRFVCTAKPAINQISEFEGGIADSHHIYGHPPFYTTVQLWVLSSWVLNGYVAAIYSSNYIKYSRNAEELIHRLMLVLRC